MNILTAFAKLVAAGVLLSAAAMPAGAVKPQVFIGRYTDTVLSGPMSQCRWEKRKGACYTDHVCTRQSKTGRCQRVEKRHVCETRDVRICS